MTISITAVDTENQIEHGVLIDLTLDGTEYNISNCYKTIIHNAKTYTALAGFLQTSDIQNNISNSTEELQLSLSAIPSSYIIAILGQPIKGGTISIYRAFFNYQTQEVLSGQVYKRFDGVITNFSVSEDTDISNQSAEITHTITVIASNIMGVLENRIAGRRTNKESYQYNWGERFFTSNITTDPSFDRVQTLHNASFDFGRKYSAPQTNNTGNNNGGAPVDTGGYNNYIDYSGGGM